MLDKPKHFCWLILGGEGYGVGNAVVSMSQELQKRNAMPHFLSLGPGPLVDRLQEAGFEIELCHDKAWNDNDALSVNTGQRVISLASKSLKYSKRVSRAIRTMQTAHQIEWLHFRSNYFVPMCTAISLRNSLVSFWHLPGDIRNTPLNILSTGYRAACKFARIVPLGNSAFTSKTLGLDASNVIYPGVDESRFHVSSAPFELPPQFRTTDSVVFGIVARLTKDKDQLTIVNALYELVAEGINANLLVVGGPVEGPYVNAIRARIQELQLERRVLLTGPTSNPLPHYLASDVIINSRINAEPFGQSIIEAMLCEKPVLALPLGGPAESIIENETGWFVGGTTAEDWAEGMRNAWKGRYNWNEMGSNGKLRAEKLFTASASAEKYCSIVKKYITQNRH